MSRKLKPKPLVIKSSVPLPAPRAKYPFAQMKVGDSFFADRYRAAQAAAWKYGVRNGMRFTVREENGGVRVWRVE